LIASVKNNQPENSDVDDDVSLSDEKDSKIKALLESSANLIAAVKKSQEQAEAEAERLKREQEAERLKREQEEAERLKREREEADKLKALLESSAKLIAAVKNNEPLLRAPTILPPTTNGADKLKALLESSAKLISAVKNNQPLPTPQSQPTQQQPQSDDIHYDFLVTDTDIATDQTPEKITTEKTTVFLDANGKVKSIQHQ
jgi:hypothetical protein